MTLIRRARWFPGLSATILGSIVLSACSPVPTTQGSGVPRAGGRVTIGSWLEHESMLDATSVNAASNHAMAFVNPVMEGLLQGVPVDGVPRNPKSADYWAPQLATAVPTVDNGDVKIRGNKMDVTWRLRRGVKWHDGVPFTSRDVKATYDFWWLKYKGKNPTPIVSTSGWDQVEGVDLPDDFTAVVHWNTIFGPYLSFGTGPYGIFPEHLLTQAWAQGGDLTKVKLDIKLEGFGYKGKDTWDKWLVGTGPFMFKEWIPGERMTLVKNPNWWGPRKAFLDEIVIKFESDTNAQLADLRSSVIDIGWDFRAGLLSALSHLEQVNSVVLTESGAEHLDLNLHNKFLKDKAVRRAILMGIDRQNIIDTLLQGRAQIPPDSWLCIGTGAWCQDTQGKTARYSIEEARKLLDDAGYKLAKGDVEKKCGKGIRANSAGECLQLSLITTSGNTLREQQQIQIAANLKLIGIDIKAPFSYNVKSGVLFGSFQNGGKLYTHQFDIAMYTNNYAFPGEPDNYYALYVSSEIPTDANGGKGQNSTFTTDVRIDRSFDEGRSRVGQDGRRQAYVDAQRALADLLPDIPLYQQLHVSAYHKRVQGYKANEFYWANNAQDWWVSQ